MILGDFFKHHIKNILEIKIKKKESITSYDIILQALL